MDEHLVEATIKTFAQRSDRGELIESPLRDSLCLS